MVVIRQPRKIPRRPMLLILAVIILAIVLGAVYFSRHQTKNTAGNSSAAKKSSSLISTDKDLQNIESENAPGGLKLDTSKLSSAWAVKVNNPRQVNIVDSSSPQSTCYYNISSFHYPTTDPAYITSVKKNYKDYLSSITTRLKSNGYAVTQAPNSTITITFKSGKKQLPTQEIKAAGPKNSFYESDAASVTDTYYLLSKVACADQNNMQTTKDLVTTSVLVTD